MHVRRQTVTSVANTLIQIHAQDIRSGEAAIALAITLGTGQAFNQFEVRAYVGEQQISFAKATADFAAPYKAPVIAASGDLTALAAASQGWVILYTAPFTRIEVWAKCVAAGPTTCTVDASGTDFPG